MRISLLIYGCFIAMFLISCNGEETPNQSQVQHTKEVFVKFKKPQNQSQYISGQMVAMNMQLMKPQSVNGKVKLYVGDSLFATLSPKKELMADLSTKDLKVGKHLIRVQAENNDGKKFADSRSIVIFSDLQPMQQVANIKNSFPHNSDYYTQGLEFNEQGQLLEGTGQKGSSLIAQYDYRSGMIINQKKLEKFYFGEGITIINGKVFQVTYQAGKCFVYDAQTLERLNEFNYTGEGWGLCNDGKYIYMSNGTSTIQKRDPETFDVVDEFMVMDNQQEVLYLNELEFFDGKIYANIYQKNVIAEIDPNNGKVKAYIDCTSAYNQVTGAGIDVLNGIAKNPVTGEILITGKWWPKMFEVSFDVKL